jgi:cell wall-associated NlpC family hydrolase
VPPGPRPAAHDLDTQLAGHATPTPTGPPSDGVLPDYGQVDEYLSLTTARASAVAQVRAAQAAVAAADAQHAEVAYQRALAIAAATSASAVAGQAQDDVSDVAREMYQQGDGGLGAFATILLANPDTFLGTLYNVQMVRSTANGIVRDAVSANADMAAAVGRQTALDARFAAARTSSATARAQLASARTTLARIDVRLGTLALVAPQVAVGPDGCPTVDVPGTLRGGAETLGAAVLCRSAVAQAATPQAARAITWAFSRLGAAYACGGVGRLLPYRMDCSSFVSRAYHEGAGLATAGDGWAPSTRNLVPWDGVALDPHYAYVAPVALRPGDLVLYDTCPQGGCPYKHVVMYLGSTDHGRTLWMMHTNSCGDVAKVERFWGFPKTGSHTFLVARRVLALRGETVSSAPITTLTPSATPSP